MIKKETWCKTLQEAIDYEINKLPSPDRFREEKKEDLGHWNGEGGHCWGRLIREEMGLHDEGNTKLFESCGSDDPKEVSLKIIEGVWKKLGGYQPRERVEVKIDKIDLNVDYE